MIQKTLTALLLCACAATALADELDFEGSWMLDVQVPAAPLIGLLELHSTNAGWVAYVEGGPAPVEINEKHIEIYIDARDRQGYLFQRKLVGNLEDGVMTGTMESIDVLETAAEFGENGSAWSARRYTDSPPEQPITNLSELAGIWAPLRGVNHRDSFGNLFPRHTPGQDRRRTAEYFNKIAGPRRADYSGYGSRGRIQTGTGRQRYRRDARKRGCRIGHTAPFARLCACRNHQGLTRIGDGGNDHGCRHHCTDYRAGRYTRS